MTAAGNMVHCQLWMGGLEPYMTESFILASFQRMGEKPLSVKVMRNKFSGEPAGYCFVHFENDDEAIDAMHKLNGKIIPNTNPAVRFRLNTATNQGKIMMNDREFSLWVGDLSAEVDDYTLYKTFAAKYQSLKAAKVILDTSGYSKGFGFLRFGIEDEQKHCLTHMNGYKGLGTKPLKISNAIPKTQRAPTANGQPNNQSSGGYQYPTDYSQYYDPNYWQNYGQWSGYGYDPSTGNYSYDPSSYNQYSNQYPGQYPTQYPAPSSQYPSQQNYAAYSHGSYSSYYPPQPASTTSTPAPAAGTGTTAGSQSSVISVPIASSVTAPVDDANSVVEHSLPVDVEKENREYGEAITNFWMDLALYSGLNQELFEDEIAKLNIVEVTMPQIPAKLENRAQAIAAIEAQDIYDLSVYDLSESSSSDEDEEDDDDDEDSFSKESSPEPVEKKRKLSSDATTTDILESVATALKEQSTSENLEDVVKEEVITEDDQRGVKKEVDGDVKVENDETTSNIDEESGKTLVKTEELPDDSQETSAVDAVPPKTDKESGDVRTKDDWKKMEGFMATVDLDVLMTETESVSSESTHNSDNGSDSEESSDGEGNDLDDAETFQTTENGDSDQGKTNLEPANGTPPKCDVDDFSRESANDDSIKVEDEDFNEDSSTNPCDPVHNSDSMNATSNCEAVNGSMETEDY